MKRFMGLGQRGGVGHDEVCSASQHHLHRIGRVSAIEPFRAAVPRARVVEVSDDCVSALEWIARELELPDHRRPRQSDRTDVRPELAIAELVDPLRSGERTPVVVSQAALDVALDLDVWTRWARSRRITGERAEQVLERFAGHQGSGRGGGGITTEREPLDPRLAVAAAARDPSERKRFPTTVRLDLVPRITVRGDGTVRRRRTASPAGGSARTASTHRRPSAGCGHAARRWRRRRRGCSDRARRRRATTRLSSRGPRT